MKLSELPARLRIAIVARCGLDGQPPRSLRQLGAQLSLSHSQRTLPDCPYLSTEYKHGYTTTVGRAHADGTVRLAREISYGRSAWSARYHRRNASESSAVSSSGWG